MEPANTAVALVLITQLSFFFGNGSTRLPGRRSPCAGTGNDVACVAISEL